MEQDQLEELKAIVDLLKANGIAEFDMERADLKLRLKFATAAPPAASATEIAQLSRLLEARAAASEHVSLAPMPLAPMPLAEVAPVHAAPPSAAAEVPVHQVKSPLVGTFYESPSPGAAAFVQPGDTVEVGQVLCIVEAMKLMNEVESDMAGELVERIAVSGQPVEYGQPLFTIRPR